MGEIRNIMKIKEDELSNIVGFREVSTGANLILIKLRQN